MKKIGVVFIHGLTGGSDTWRNSKGQTFGDLLLTCFIGQQIEVYYFDYYTKILSIFDSAIAKRIIGRIPGLRKIGLLQGRIKKNQPIEQLGEKLHTWIRLNLSHLDQLVLIAHSMGGLVAKDYILNHSDDSKPTVAGFLSIAVPHKGALSAQLLSLINRNAKELVPLDTYASRLNDLWVNKKSDAPENFYVVALNDECVDKESAVPGTVSNKQKFTVDHDHLSVCKPEDVSDPVLKCAVLLLQQLIRDNERTEQLAAQFNSSQPSYEKEIFVIKLILGDIGKAGMEIAKESFFQAEIIEKHSCAKDRQQLANLQRLVVNLYRAIYNSYDKNPDRNALFNEVHKLILTEDSAALKSAVECVTYLHKQGLLHQSANRLTDEVIWTDEPRLAEIESLAK